VSAVGPSSSGPIWRRSVLVSIAGPMGASSWTPTIRCHPPPQRKVDPRAAARAAAAELLAELGVERPPIDVEAIARRLGAPVTYAPLGNVEGEFRDGRIIVNQGFSRVRRRYTVAHEIGHLRMHADGDRTGPEVEREAQAFAGALLIPPPMLIVAVAEDDGFESLRHRFDVSRDALSIALTQARLTAS
jgi:hypothetical protein